MNAPTITCNAIEREGEADARRTFALTGVNIARAELARITLRTDAPDWRDVEAADLLDAAHALLAGDVRP